MTEVKIIKIWLDDQRNAPEGWIHLHNIEEVERLVELIRGGNDFLIDTMSFDFHLAHPKNGLDVMKYLADLCIKEKTKIFWPKNILYHSSDTKAVVMMKNFVESLETNLLCKC